MVSAITLSKPPPLEGIELIHQAAAKPKAQPQQEMDGEKSKKASENVKKPEKKKGKKKSEKASENVEKPEEKKGKKKYKMKARKHKGGDCDNEPELSDEYED